VKEYLGKSYLRKCGRLDRHPDQIRSADHERGIARTRDQSPRLGERSAPARDASLALGPGSTGRLDANRCIKLLMHITSAQLMPIATLVAGVLVLIIPRCLSYVVAIYLIAVGLTGLNGIYHLVK
jgi:hypothetical protein